MFWRLKMKKILTILFTLLALCGNVLADEPKTKFYDFDDLLINGEYKKPQVLYIDSDSQVKFERLLKLKKNLLIKLRETKTDNSLR
jgi:aldehyde:ferredoxin oxidoreductase